MTRILPLVLGAMVLGGCAQSPEDCDPNKGNVFTSVSALAGGCYDERVSNKKTELSRTQSLTEQLRSENREMTDRQAIAKQENIQQRAQLAQLETERRNLEKQLERLGNSGVAADRKADLSARIDQVGVDIVNAQDATRNNPSSAELRKEIERLRRERDKLAADIAAAMSAQ